MAGIGAARVATSHYSMIVARSVTLKDVEVGLFLDWIGWLVAVTLATGLLLKLSIERYKRRT